MESKRGGDPRCRPAGHEHEEEHEGDHDREDLEGTAARREACHREARDVLEVPVDDHLPVDAAAAPVTQPAPSIRAASINSTRRRRAPRTPESRRPASAGRRCQMLEASAAAIARIAATTSSVEISPSRLSPSR